MTGLRERLAREQEVLLLDGGLGSELIAMGLASGQAPEGWVLELPGRIEEVHRRYVEAGADVIHSSTFGATRPKLDSAGVGAARCDEVNRGAVALARRAAGGRCLVAGDVGPTGELFAPMGSATEEQLDEAFAEQVGLLAEAGVDLISIETMFDLREARSALRAARATGLPVICSMTFDTKKRGNFTMVGDRLGPALQTLAADGADAVGLNCTVTPEQMIPMVREAREAVDVPLAAQPNAGQPRATGEGIVYDAAPEPFAAGLLQMVDIGARIVGGCCGSNPRFIRAARDALDRRA